MIANEPQTLRDEYSRATKILDAECNQVSASLDDVIKTCENLHVEEQYQLKTLLQKYEHLFDGTLREFNLIGKAMACHVSFCEFDSRYFRVQLQIL
jgi:hypothetical protein